MIDIQEPKAHTYSEEEKRVLKAKFLLLIHSMLVVYLTLHNLLIPLITNLLIHRPLLTEVHYWFLFQLPVQYILRKNKPLPEGYLWFLILGSISRFLITIMAVPTLKSWTFASVLISEVSSFIFYFIYYPYREKGALRIMTLGGLLLPLIFWKFEVDAPAKMMFSTKVAERTINERLGCLGTEYKLSLPIKSYPATVSSVAIKNCGFGALAVTASHNLSIRNEQIAGVNIRLYELKFSQNRLKWKFKRLVRVESSKVWQVGELIKEDGILYLLKSPEKRSIGHLIIFPQRTSDFPLKNGSAIINYDTINWIPHE